MSFIVVAAEGLPVRILPSAGHGTEEISGGHQQPSQQRGCPFNAGDAENAEENAEKTEQYPNCALWRFPLPFPPRLLR